MSPLDFAYSPQADDLTASGHSADLLWGYQPGFGAFLKALRTKAGLTLREAAAEMGMSHSNLSRLEMAHEEVGPIKFDTLDRMAAVYGRDARELHHAHGYRYAVDEDALDPLVDEEEAFATVVLSRELKPVGLRRGVLDALHPRLKRQLVELLRNLAAQPEPMALLDRLLSQGEKRGPS